MTYVLLILLILLLCLDGLTTYRLLSRGGYELNPVIKFCINRFGLGRGLMLSKGCISIILAYVTLFYAPIWWV